MKKSAKIIAAIAATAIAGSAAIGGTMAWLTSRPDPVTNTFTMGSVNITLTEPNTIDVDGNSENGYQVRLAPGTITTKDPTVTVLGISEPCYVFVAVKDTLSKEGEFSLQNSKLSTDWKKQETLPTGCSMPEGYTLYRYQNEVDSESDVPLKLFDGIIVANTVTSVPADATIDIKAFAIQKENLDTGDTAVKEAIKAFGGEVK